ncbi:hypothetical protein bsdE14_26210 [Clostridium omnivorum]|uniref:Uncharacterized protein n=2 Tax=Clostridium omnivorum TaxID=1604902 RepID=A0ABQ5N7N4_9CLOT|nr:hypothetical protein bsdE14_26210 [Clostridium sp. E14]
MHCPYCNNELKYNNGELYCVTGDCFFSKHIENRFEENSDDFYNTREIKSKEVNAPEGRFYCVKCGEKMKKIGFLHEMCSSCGFEIDKLMYREIIELNPHTSF